MKVLCEFVVEAVVERHEINARCITVKPKILSKLSVRVGVVVVESGSVSVIKAWIVDVVLR